MKFAWTLAILCVFALAIDHAESWGRRRRRWRIKKIVKAAIKVYKYKLVNIFRERSVFFLLSIHDNNSINYNSEVIYKKGDN